MFWRASLLALLLTLLLPISGEAHLFEGPANVRTDSQDFKQSADKRKNQTLSGKTVTRQGRVVILEAQGADGGHITHVLLKRSEEEQFLLQGPGVEDLSAGDRVKVEGSLDSSRQSFQSRGRLWAEDLQVVAKNKKTRTHSLGKKGVAIAFLSWPGSGLSGYPRYGNYLQSNLADWSSSASGGRFTWDPVDVINLNLSAAPPGCGGPGSLEWLPDYRWQEIVRGELVKRGYKINDYRALAIAMPQGFAEECIWTAYAYIDPSCTWGIDYYCNLSVYGYEYSQFAVFVHELGHTLYLPHANQAPCVSDGLAVTLTFIGRCDDIEYGDVYDPMGFSFSSAMYNPAFAEQLEWVDEDDALHRRGSPESSVQETLTLRPYGSLEGLRVASFSLPGVAQLGGQSPGEIYLEYRANRGLDSILYEPSPDFPNVSCLAFTPSSNVFLRFVPSYQAADLLGIAPFKDLYQAIDESYLLDVTPQTASACDSGLTPGSSWSDPSGELEISFSERAGDLSWAKMDIERHPWTAPVDSEPPRLIDVTRPKSPRRGYSVTYDLSFSERISRFKEDSIAFATGSTCSVAVGEGKQRYRLFLEDCSKGSITPKVKMDLFTDMAGNHGQGEELLPTVIFDHYIARPQLKKKPKKITQSSRARFTWAKNQEGSFSCALDGGRFLPCGQRKSYRNLSPGKHRFSLRVKDFAGNRKKVSYSWRIQGS